ncbi:hypothetical protein ACWC5C_25720 [Streptomyces sp. NPDC001700]
MPAAQLRPRTDEDLAACVSALATVQRADRYPVHWPDDPQGWLTPADMLGAWVAAEGPAVLGHVTLTRTDPDWRTANGQLAVVHAYSGSPGH